MCRFGSQDLFRLLGRDPIDEPLTPLEEALFIGALQLHWEAEIGPLQALAGATVTSRPERGRRRDNDGERDE